MGLRSFFLPNFPGTKFIQGGTFIPDSKSTKLIRKLHFFNILQKINPKIQILIQIYLFEDYLISETW